MKTLLVFCIWLITIVSATATPFDDLPYEDPVPLEEPVFWVPNSPMLPDGCDLEIPTVTLPEVDDSLEIPAFTALDGFVLSTYWGESIVTIWTLEYDNGMFRIEEFEDGIIWLDPLEEIVAY